MNITITSPTSENRSRIADVKIRSIAVRAAWALLVRRMTRSDDGNRMKKLRSCCRIRLKMLLCVLAMMLLPALLRITIWK